jgi:hypothetical protein
MSWCQQIKLNKILAVAVAFHTMLCNLIKVIFHHQHNNIMVIHQFYIANYNYFYCSDTAFPYVKMGNVQVFLQDLHAT